MNHTALVTGATGVIGPSLVRLLLDRGWNVRILARRCVPAPWLGPDVACCYGDIADPIALQQAADGTDTVFHLAAKLHVNDPSPQMKAEYQRVNVEGAARLAEAARAAGARRLVVFSTINVYGSSRPDEYLDEDSPLRSTSYYSATKIEAEQIALATLPTVVLRLSAVYGPSMKGNYLRLLRALQRGRFAFVGDGLNRRTLVHVEDVCAAAILAAEHPRAAGRVFNVTDGSIHTLRKIVEAMCLALDRKPPRLRLPVGPVRVTAGLVEDALRIVFRRRFPAKAAVDKIVEDIAVLGNRIIGELGFRPQYNLVRGWQETVAALDSAQDVGGPTSPPEHQCPHFTSDRHRARASNSDLRST